MPAGAGGGGAESGVRKPHPAVPVLAGCVAGAIEATVTWPMEFIKTQLQLQSRAQVVTAGGVAPPVRYNGMIGGLVWHTKNQGFLSLYRGLSPVLLFSIPKAGIRFGAYDLVKTALTPKDGTLSPLRSLSAGMIAGALEAVACVTPMETIKTKLIDGNMGLVKGVQKIVHTEGIGGLYKGVVPTVLKQSSNHGLRFMWFSEYKKRIGPFLESTHLLKDYSQASQSQMALVNFLGGVSAGTFSVMCNNPMDVVKTRMQGLEAHKYRSSWDCFVRIARHEGILAFYAGTLPRLGRVIPGQGVIFMSYESIKTWISKLIDK